jgi:hypothetical protein
MHPDLSAAGRLTLATAGRTAPPSAVLLLARRSRAALIVCVLQVGMRHFHYSRNKYHCPIVNLDKIWSLVGEEVRDCAGLQAGSIACDDLVIPFGFAAGLRPNMMF